MDDYYNQQLGGQDFSRAGQMDNHGDVMDGITTTAASRSESFADHDASMSPDTADQSNDGQESRNKHGADSMSHLGQQAMPQFAGMMPGGGMNNFQFAPSLGMGQHAQFQNAPNMFSSGTSGTLAGQSGNGSVNFVPFLSGAAPYGMAFPQVQAFQTPNQSSMQPNMGMATAFFPQNMPMNPDTTDPNIGSMMRNGMMPVNFMPQGQMMQPIMMAPFFQNLPGQSHSATSESGVTNAASTSNTARSSPMRENPNLPGNFPPNPVQQTMQNINTQMQSRNNSIQRHRQNSVSSAASMQPSQQNQQPMNVAQSIPQASREASSGVGKNSQWNLQGQTYPVSGPARPQQESYKNAYSSTGFDMLAVLMKVATRKSPEINIGAVDLSCAFVVCDAHEHDCPIVYCSENFERLTGYTKHEILGRNCRFLQAPSGLVQAGVRRSYVDDESVLYIKNKITMRQEAQCSVINYRKGGQPFMNLLTMVPVSYESDDVKFFVGFQVDLVEQPGSVTNKNLDGSYTVNYQRGLSMPRYVFTGNDHKGSILDSGQSIPRDEVSTVLSTIGSGESELSRRIWDKVLLENADDVVFVLSLKGLFLYLSPSCRKVLEYESTELMGTALSSVCHPSDIVPVTRELKDTASGSSVSVVFRIRRKDSGYMWFEGHGALHTEQGKGRKSIVLTGRERPVCTLNKAEVTAIGGIGENEVWTKLSTSGMFLFVSSAIRSLLDKHPSDLVGCSIQSLMRIDSRHDFSRILEIARSGRRAQTKHELLNKRGQVLQAFSVVYPGDASRGHKPTFLIAQTRLLKYSRSQAAPSSTNTPQQRVGSSASADRDANNSSPNAGNHGQNSTTAESGSGNLSAAQALSSPAQYMSTFESATTFAGQNGLPLGNQDQALADDLNLFDELKTTRSTSWQFELRQMEKRNRLLAEELQSLLAARKKRKRRKGAGMLEKDCANCHTKTTPEWRRGPSGNRDLCNSCGLRWAKQQGRISPRTTTGSARSAASGQSDKTSGSPTGIHGNSSQQPSHYPGRGSASGSAAESRSIDEALASGQANASANVQRTSTSARLSEDEQRSEGERGCRRQSGSLDTIDRASQHVSKMAKMDSGASSQSSHATRDPSTAAFAVPSKVEGD